MLQSLLVLHEQMKLVAERAQVAVNRGDVVEQVAEARTLSRLVLCLGKIAPGLPPRNLLTHAQWFLRKAHEPGDCGGNLRDLLTRDLPALERSLDQMQQQAIFPPRHLERDLELCFVAMPFRREMGDVYQAIQGAITGAGLRCVRVDEVHNLGPIVQKIWDCISRAGIMVADLTGYNPNVMYELGLAHAQGTPVVQIAQEMPVDQRLPFDVAHINTLFYQVATPAGLADLREKLQELLVGGRQQTA